ncbi:uncharacterized protein LOC113331813 [Papaver somniferum]|uniref:uncharacterized protein LOC113331813 n=1 Tax=Papaver somniferum TaxID=3469 RepID=UPI000E6FB985|nr:uncharacterized protein LOC113331813 [Papaver somniferum]
MQALVHNESLEADLLRYAVYKIREACRKAQQNPDPKKEYHSVLYLDASAWLHVDRSQLFSGQDKDSVDKPILEMDKNVDKIMIPMCHGAGLGSHCTLLIFYFKEKRFVHYNSLKSGKHTYEKSAKKMADRCLDPINNFLVQ